jgi:putative transposase
MNSRGSSDPRGLASTMPQPQRGCPMRTSRHRRNMATYTDITYHLVFGTKHRVPALDEPRRDELYRFIWGLLKARDCHLYRIGGVEDHVHILTSLHPTVALADLVKEIKTTSSAWIKGRGAFPLFEHWQEGYGAFTLDAAARPDLIDYIKNQEEHHRERSFVEELRELVERYHLVWKPDHLP